MFHDIDHLTIAGETLNVDDEPIESPTVSTPLASAILRAAALGSMPVFRQGPGIHARKSPAKHPASRARLLHSQMHLASGAAEALGPAHQGFYKTCGAAIDRHQIKLKPLFQSYRRPSDGRTGKHVPSLFIFVSHSKAGNSKNGRCLSSA